MLEGFTLPQVTRVRQKFDDTVLDDPAAKLRGLLAERKFPIRKGDRIAITAGSRGIARYADVMKTVVEHVKDLGAEPFLVPAMGSHGGGTADGQLRLLHKLGITEEAMGAPIHSSMEVKQVGATDIGLPVYIDRNACEADGIILLNRVKSHTSIREPFQSGLIKMLAIGLAKHKGAVMTHATGVPNLGPNMVRMGMCALENLNVVGGVATIENGYGGLADVYALRKEEIPAGEPEILKRAVSMLPRIYLDAIDCLVLCEIGKDIAGTGMDPAVVGRPINRRANEGPSVETLGLLRLTPASDGNASGLGMAEYVTRRLRDAVNEEYTMVNSFTGMHPEIAAIPATLDTDRLVFLGCRQGCGQLRDEDVRLAIVKNSKHLDEVYMSRAAVDAIVRPEMTEVDGKYMEVPFDADGNLRLFGI